ncbi:class I SAM-dependent methyltransferase [Trujillonella humicola]|uniref:class I SAM-dependent methyltransferase n=1 Tax=Trujillonella humicola TaxID=3383699 RepID=UPI003905A519
MPSQRLAWVAGVVAARAGERVLEVGCGHGVLVDLLAGHGCEVVAVDRSATMVAAAARRNRAALAAGRVRLQAVPLLDADLGERPFDVVVAVDVRAFWTPPAPEWDVVARVLAPGGRVVAGFSVMRPGAEDGVAAAVGTLAGPRGLAVSALRHGDTAPLPTAAVVLTRRGEAATAPVKREPGGADHPVR